MIKFKTKVSLEMLPAKMEPRPAITRSIDSIDFRQNFWQVDANKKTITAIMRGWPNLVVMGEGTPTPFIDGATESQRQEATLIKLGLVVQDGIVTHINGTPVP